jgi:threonine/homoserine/homoserine lactone efflux protein
MENPFLLKGLIVGFAIAAAIGPIGILCIRKTFEYGRLSGLFSGLGAAIADTLFGTIAAFGLTFVSDFLLAGQFWLRLIGGLFLVYLGSKTFLTKPTLELRRVTHKTLINDFVTTFFLTLVNPTTILSFLAIFAGLGIGQIGGNYSHAFWLVLGIFIGSTIWWVILCEGVTFFRQKISQKVMTAINRGAGIVIAAFGILAWITLL